MVLDTIFDEEFNTNAGLNNKTVEKKRDGSNNDDIGEKKDNNADDEESSLESKLMIENMDMEEYNAAQTRLDTESLGDFVYFKQLIEGYNIVLKIDGENYLYINEQRGWSQLRSEIAAKTMCNMMDFRAPVNFTTAAKPIVESLLYYHAPCVCMPLTFTQGAMRYSFHYCMNEKDQSIVQLTPAILLNINEVQNNNILINQSARETFCTAPTAIRHHVKSIIMPAKLILRKRRWYY